ncbi:MAG TPA: hypothetical protein VFP93_03540 [Gammaproteobacteria bacterium]|nr:hypothetical protein [Gammaproteobacteria bacterium]
MWSKFFFPILILIIYPAFGNLTLYEVKKESIPEIFEIMGTWVPITWEPIMVPFPGVLKKIHCPFGSNVKKGDKLFELQDEELPLKIQEAHLAYQNKMQAYEKLLHWSTSPEYLQAKRNLQLESQNLDEKRRHLQETETLVVMGGLAKEVLLQEQRDFAYLKLRLSELQQRFDIIQKKGDSLALAQANIDATYAKMHFDKLKHQEQQLMQRAELDGTLYSANLFQTGQDYRHVKEGMRIESDQWLGVLTSVDSFGATFEVSENWVDKIEQAGTVHLEVKGELLAAKVYSIEPVGLSSQTPPKYIVKIQPIKSPRIRVKIGTFVKLQISNTLKHTGIKIPLQLVFWDKNQPFVYKWNATKKHMQKHFVGLGALNPPWIEVTTGLLEGDKIGSQA